MLPPRARPSSMRSSAVSSESGPATESRAPRCEGCFRSSERELGSTMTDGIHFWAPVGPTREELAAWDPDSDPSAFASGLGHNMLELAVRLRREGVDVSFGRDVPRGTRLVVLLGALSRPP